MIDSVTFLMNARRRLGWAALLAPAAALYLTIWGINARTLVLVAVAFVGSIAIPVIAADLVPVALIYLGLHWLLYALVNSSGTQVRVVPNAIIDVFGAASEASMANALKAASVVRHATIVGAAPRLPQLPTRLLTFRPTTTTTTVPH
jgi:hypothetical protein